MGIRTTIHGNKKKWDSKNDSWKPLVANLQVDLVDIVDENGRDSDDFSWASRGNRHQYHQCYHHLTSLTHQRLPYHWRHKTWNRVIRRLQNSQIRPLTLIVYSQFWRCCLKNIPKTYLTFYPRKQSWTWKITVIIIIGVLSWFHFSTPLHSNRYKNGFRSDEIWLWWKFIFSNFILQCVQKKKPKWFFLVISFVKLEQFWWNLVHRFWINLLQNHVNVFHLIRIMSLHYLVKLGMLSKHVLPLSWNRKKLQNLFHLKCGPQIRQIWIHFITACEKYCKRRCKKYS